MELFKAKEIILESENNARGIFNELAENALYNQDKVLKAFIANRVNSGNFNSTTGYGYDDVGRDGLNRLYADVFGADDALVSPLIANGTHALTLALFGVLRPNDVMLSVAGKPYDTLDDVINGENNGSLKEFGVRYQEVALTAEYKIDYAALSEALKAHMPKLAFIQRSKGYLWRNALSISEIADVIKFIKNISPKTIVLVDNCYGEFVEEREPTEVGADIAVGSLIKNPGGGLAPSGGYIVGKSELIEQISYRLTAPSLGREVGSYASGYRLFYQGLFNAPSVVKNALMGCALGGYALNAVGCETMPVAGDRPYDIINSIKLSNAEELISFCQIIQSVSPIESYVLPEPWAMPGYPNEVIMAAGTFVQGASLELSADGTIREPYICYLQGGLTYEHCKLALTEVLKKLF